MNINATIVVQAINFLCVYLILRFFLFKPAVKIIQAEKDMCAQTERAIEHTHTLIDQVQQYDLQAWNTLHTHYDEMQNSIPVVEPILSKISPHVEYPTVSDDVVAQLTTQTTARLMNVLSEK